MITNILILINIVSVLIMDLYLQVSLAVSFQGFNIKHFCVFPLENTPYPVLGY